MNHRQRVNISCLLIISALFKKHDVALTDCDLLRHYFINEQVLNIVPLLRWFMHSLSCGSDGRFRSLDAAVRVRILFSFQLPNIGKKRQETFFSCRSKMMEQSSPVWILLRIRLKNWSKVTRLLS